MKLRDTYKVENKNQQNQMKVNCLQCLSMLGNAAERQLSSPLAVGKNLETRLNQSIEPLKKAIKLKKHKTVEEAAVWVNRTEKSTIVKSGEGPIIEGMFW